MKPENNRECGVKDAQLGFRLESEGSTPIHSLHVKSLRISPCEWGVISQIFRDCHYRGEAIGGSLRHCFALLWEGVVIGGAAFGDPRHRDKYGGVGNVLELRRFALVDEAPKNSESYFIGRCCWWLKNNTTVRTIVSYADPEQGHHGTIYRATGFKCVGMTGAGHVVRVGGRDYHARSLTIDRPYSAELRQQVDGGEAQVIRTAPKYIYEKSL